MKTIFFIAFTLSFSLIAQIGFAQDVIYLKNGDQIEAKVLEIGISEIRYQKFNNLSGPTYVVSKADLIKIRYQDQKEDVFSTQEDNQKTPNKTKEEKPIQNNGSNYIDRVREVQANDPGFCLYLGNGFGAGTGYSNPLIGFDVRFSKKNPWIRGIALGLRVGFKNLALIGDFGDYREIFGFSVAAKYYVPLPIKKIQPYVIFHGGVAYVNYYYFNGTYTTSGYKSHDYAEGYLPFMGFGIGTNFMVAKRFGFFIEGGYFTASLFNVGLSFKF